MLDEVAIIDVFERMKSSLLEAAPAFEHEIQSLRERSFKGQPGAFFQEKLVATLLDVDLSSATGRRQIRRLLQTLDDDEPLARALDALIGVAESRALRVSDVSQKNVLDLRDSLAGLDGLANGGMADCLDAFGDPTKAVEAIASAIPALRGLKVYHFLRGCDYPVVTPDAARQRLLYRLGLWPEAGQSRARMLEFQDLCGSVARLTGEPAGVLDLVLGLYSGAVARKRLFAPVCLNQPVCEDCPVASRCSYHRYKGPPTVESDGSSIAQMTRENRPREKFERLGSAQASDSELLAILLRTGAAGKSALEVATNLLRVFETLEGVDAASINELTAVKGIGRNKAIEVKAALELGKRLFTRPLSKGVTISCSGDVFAAYQMRFRNAGQEEFLLLCLNTKNQVIKEVRVSVGSLNQSIVHPREVFKEAIRESAHGVLFVHNHPSGDPRPSNADIALTRRLTEAGDMLSIKIRDHVVIGDQTYFSFLDHKML